MNQIKLSLFVFFIITNLIFSYNANAACSTRTLKRVCDVCEERALKKLDTDSVCPSCPEVSCPANNSCIRLDSFDSLLRPVYAVTSASNDGGSKFLFWLNIQKNNESPSSFNYEIWSSDNNLLLKDTIGFLLYDVISFNVPVPSGASVLSYSCTGGIDSNSVLKGLCSTIAPDESGNPKSYSWDFTGLPLFN